MDTRPCYEKEGAIDDAQVNQGCTIAQTPWIVGMETHFPFGGKPIFKICMQGIVLMQSQSEIGTGDCS
jgi:hypothetical protein